MHRVTLLAALMIALPVAPLLAQGAGKGDPDRSVAGGGSLPAGWSARPDDDEKLDNVKFVTMGKGYHITLGPATLLYREANRGTGPFHALATFTQTKAPMHPEGYGLFYGGTDLEGANQHYTYFLVRGDGTYLIKRRDGEQTTELTPWTANDAIKKADAQGKATNLLEIDTKQDPKKVVFLINGQAVHSMPATAADVNGVVGLRVNHNLDLHVEGFDVHR